MSKLSTTVITTLGVVGGCRILGPCLSVAACLSVAPDTGDTGCDTGDTGDTADTGCDTGDTGAADRAERARALEDAGVLPPGIAERVGRP